MHTVKLDHYGPLTDWLNGEPLERQGVSESSETKTADFTTDPLNIKKTVRIIIKLKWSGYDGTDGKVKLQLSDQASTDDVDWSDWGGISAQGDMSTASGSCIFHIWQSVPGYVRAKFELGTGTTADVTATYRLKTG